MPAGLPHRPPLAMKLWLARMFGRTNAAESAPTPGHTPGAVIGIESIEHLVQNRMRVLFRHTWLVTILGTVILAGLVGLAAYYLTQNKVMKIAAGPEGGIDAKLVAAISNKIAKERDKIDLRLVVTAGP
jgi:hypothetical protein